MLLRRKIVSLIGAVMVAVSQHGMASTCEGDNIAIPDRATIASVQKKAESGDALAQAKIGMAYLTGKGANENIDKGIYWLSARESMGSDSIDSSRPSGHAPSVQRKRIHTTSLFHWRLFLMGIVRV